MHLNRSMFNLSLFYLQVFSLPYSTPDDVLPHVEIAAEISLKDSNPHLHPIRIETGYLEEYSETQSRAQVHQCYRTYKMYRLQ